MGMPVWQGQAAFGHTTGKLTRAMPAGLVDGDIMVFVVETANEVATIELPASGWTQAVNSPQGTGTAGVDPATRVTAWWKRVVSPEADLRTFDPGDHICGVFFWIRGALAAGTPIVVSAGSVLTPASVAAVSLPGLNTTGFTDCLIIQCATHHFDTNNPVFAGPWVNAGLANVTERVNNSGGSGNGGGILVVTGEKSVAGVVAATTGGAPSSAVVQAYLTLAIQGAAGGITLTVSDFTCGGGCDSPIGSPISADQRHWNAAIGTLPISQIQYAASVGGRPWLFQPTNNTSALSRFVSDTKRHHRSYMLLPTLPSGDCELIRYKTASGSFSPELRYRAATQDIVAACGTNIGTPMAVVAGRLYRVATAADVSGTTRTMKLTVDGVDKGTASKTGVTSDVITEFQIGASCGTPVTAKTVWGAIITGQDVASYPFGAGSSFLVPLVADGTHVYSASGDFLATTVAIPLGYTTAYLSLVGLLSNALADYLARGTAIATEYLECLFGGMPAVTSIAGVEIVSVHRGGSVSSPQTLRLVDGATVVDVLTAGDVQGAGPFVNSKHYRLAPSGVAWTQALVNGLKLRWPFSAAGTPGLGGVVAEVDCVLSVASGGTPGSQEKNPSHVYAAAGTYTVRETVTDSDGLTSTVTHAVTVA